MSTGATRAAILATLGASTPPTLGEVVSCLSMAADRHMCIPTDTWLSATRALTSNSGGLGALTMREMLDLTMALASMRARGAVLPDADFLAQLMRAWVPCIPRMGLEDLSLLAAHLAMLNHSSSTILSSSPAGGEAAWAEPFRGVAAERLKDARESFYKQALYRRSADTASHQDDPPYILLKRGEPLSPEVLSSLISSLARGALPSVAREGHDAMWIELWATTAAFIRCCCNGPRPSSSLEDSILESPDSDQASLVRMVQAAAELLSLRDISPPLGWLRLAVLSAERCAPHLTPELAASLSCALATLGARRLAVRGAPCTPAFQALGSRLSEVIPDLSPDQLSSLCLHLPRLRPPRTRALALALAQAALVHMDAVGPAGLPALALAMADNNVVSEAERRGQTGPEGEAFGGPGTGQRLLEGLMGASFDCLPQMDGEGLVTLVACAARLRSQPSRAWMARWVKKPFKPIRSCLDSLLPRRTVLRLLNHLQHKLPQLPPSSLARASWALARLGCRPPAEWWAVFLTEVAGRMSCFEARYALVIGCLSQFSILGPLLTVNLKSVTHFIPYLDTL